MEFSWWRSAALFTKPRGREHDSPNASGTSPSSADCYREEEEPMPVREGPPHPVPPPAEHKMPPVDGPIAYPAEKRGGEIILYTPARRIIFIAGLACAFVLVLLLRMFA